MNIVPLENYISRSWLRQHLYYLGFDLVRLQSYQKLSKTIGTNAGGLIKSLVSDIATFVNKELTNADMVSASSSSTQGELKNLMYLYNNELISDANVKVYNISDYRLFFIFIGYMILNNDKSAKLDTLIDKLIEIYLNSSNFKLNATTLNLNNDTDNLKVKVLNLANDYYQSAAINYDKLYNNHPKTLSLFITKHVKIDLPPLPKINNKLLLAKSLMHKELYRGLIQKHHPFYKIMVDHDIIPSPEIYAMLRNDLSYFDGLGDYYLSKESSDLLYKFKNSLPYNNETIFGKKSYTLLKTILATNTLLSRLALTYNLHYGLNDEIINGVFRNDYVPYLDDWKDLDFETCQNSKSYRYEQEFIADYFEQYVGSLVLEQPEVAKQWIHEIYENILFSIGDHHKIPSKSLVQYDYHSWGVDVIGRRLR